MLSCQSIVFLFNCKVHLNVKHCFYRELVWIFHQIVQESIFIFIKWGMIAHVFEILKTHWAIGVCLNFWETSSNISGYTCDIALIIKCSWCMWKTGIHGSLDMIEFFKHFGCEAVLALWPDIVDGKVETNIVIANSRACVVDVCFVNISLKVTVSAWRMWARLGFSTW